MPGSPWASFKTDENTDIEDGETAGNSANHESVTNVTPALAKRNIGNRIVVPEGETATATAI